MLVKKLGREKRQTKITREIAKNPGLGIKMNPISAGLQRCERRRGAPILFFSSLALKDAASPQLPQALAGIIEARDFFTCFSTS